MVAKLWTTVQGFDEMKLSWDPSDLVTLSVDCEAQDGNHCVGIYCIVGLLLLLNKQF